MNGNLADLMTIGDVAKELHYPLTRARALTDTIDPALVVSRVKLYSREDVVTKLREQNYNLLKFLGVRPVAESYDTVISDDVVDTQNV
jgi:hypothetical protein